MIECRIKDGEMYANNNWYKQDQTCTDCDLCAVREFSERFTTSDEPCGKNCKGIWKLEEECINARKNR